MPVFLLPAIHVQHIQGQNSKIAKGTPNLKIFPADNYWPHLILHKNLDSHLSITPTNPEKKAILTNPRAGYDYVLQTQYCACRCCGCLSVSGVSVSLSVSGVCQSVLWVSVGAVRVCQAEMCGSVSGVGVCQCCGKGVSQSYGCQWMQWVLVRTMGVNAVDVSQCCGCWSVLWVPVRDGVSPSMLWVSVSECCGCQ